MAGLLQYDNDDIDEIRKECDIYTEERQEETFKIIEEWLSKQHHLVKKTYSRRYLESCLVTCKGSIEAVKTQIDKICTLRTLHPIYFQYSNIRDKEFSKYIDKCYFGISSKLTKEKYVVCIMKVKPSINVSSMDFVKLHTLYNMLAEYIRVNQYYRGFMFLFDCLEANLTELLPKVNIVELQTFLPIITQGQGIRIKRLVFLTKSTYFTETIIRLVKSLFKEKMRNRIHIENNIENLHEFVPVENLPKEYGGTEKPLEKLHEDLLEAMSTESTENLLKEMNAACTDESKRQRDVFNDQYMGMPGTFRTLKLD